MARPLRFVPPRSLVEVTTRTVQGRLLLRPGRDINEIILGILGRAIARYSVEVCSFIFLSNHFHLLLLPDDAKQLALFMGYVNSNLAREAGRLYSWRDRFWARRYRAIVVSDEESVQEERMRYLLENGCKENLVRRPRDGPCASAVDSLGTGHPLRGVWFDRTKEYNARRRGERVSKYDHSEVLEFNLSPLPAWRNLPPKEIRRKIAAMVAEIEAECRQRIRDTGRLPLGARRILRLDPRSVPQRLTRSPAPRFHAKDPGVRRGLELAYYAFRVAYRQAADALQEGIGHVEFPAGSFRPRLPFVRPQPPPGRTPWATQPIPG